MVEHKLCLECDFKDNKSQRVKSGDLEGQQWRERSSSSHKILLVTMEVNKQMSLCQHTSADLKLRLFLSKGVQSVSWRLTYLKPRICGLNVKSAL